MDQTSLRQLLTGKDNNVAYSALKEAESLSESSNEFYPLFDWFLELFESDNNYFSVRGARMIAAVAKRDEEGKVCKALPHPICRT